MNTNCMLIDLFDVFIYEQKNPDIFNDIRSFSALSLRIDSKDTQYRFGGKTIKAETGDICLVPQNLKYIRSAAKEKIIVFHFNAFSPIDAEIKCFKPKDINKYETLFYEAYNIWQRKSEGYRYKCLSVLFDIFSQLEADGMRFNSSGDETVTKAMDFIEKNFKNNNFKVEEISKFMFLSDSGIRQKFKNTLGKTPKEYLDQRRIREAETMLKSGYFSQKEKQ